MITLTKRNGKIMRRMISSSRSLLYSNHPFMWDVNNQDTRMRATTICVVRKNNETVMIGDGQVSVGSCIAKSTIKKVHKINDGKVLVGYAGNAVDCITMLDTLENELKSTSDLLRACTNLGKTWHATRGHSSSGSSLLVADKESIFQLSSDGAVLQPPNAVFSIGSGGHFALSAALALLDIEPLSAEDICKKAMRIAGDTCVYTNHETVVEKIVVDEKN